MNELRHCLSVHRKEICNSTLFISLRSCTSISSTGDSLVKVYAPTISCSIVMILMIFSLQMFVAIHNYSITNNEENDLLVSHYYRKGNYDIVHAQSKFDAHQRRASITYQLTSPRAKATVIN